MLKLADVESAHTENFRIHRHFTQLFKRCRLETLIASLCAFTRRGYFWLEKWIGAIHIFKFTKLISHVLFYPLSVNCAFRFVGNYAIATSFDCQFKEFRSCESDNGALPHMH